MREFHFDCSEEEYREYYYPPRRRGEAPYVVRIDRPLQLKVRIRPDGDAHHIVDEQNRKHYVAVGWRHIVSVRRRFPKVLDDVMAADHGEHFSLEGM